MKHITALSDSKYLLYGIALLESLKNTSSIPITVHYFCIDQSCYDILTRMSLPNVAVYHPSTLFNDQNKQLCHLKNTNFQYLCWSLASVFTNYIMQTANCDSVTYIDSDIYFHMDIAMLFAKFGEKDCGIFRHRFLEDYQESPYGKYNVGVVYFKKSTLGQEVLRWWADAVLYKKYPEYATCGDQRYLDLFPRLCGKENIYIDEGIGHGAPWNWLVYDLSKISSGTITWRTQVQPLVFTHFSKFVYDLQKNTFQCTDVNIYHPYTNYNKIYENKPLYELHEQYFNSLKRANTSITNNG